MYTEVWGTNLSRQIAFCKHRMCTVEACHAQSYNKEETSVSNEHSVLKYSGWEEKKRKVTYRLCFDRSWLWAKAVSQRSHAYRRWPDSLSEKSSLFEREEKDRSCPEAVAPWPVLSRKDTSNLGLRRSVLFLEESRWLSPPCLCILKGAPRGREEAGD